MRFCVFFQLFYLFSHLVPTQTTKEGIAQHILALLTRWIPHYDLKVQITEYGDT